MGDSTMLARHAATRTSSLLRRSAQTESRRGLKVLLALYEDPQSGYPPNYARNEIPEVTRYPGITHDYVQTAPTPEGRDFNPGDLLGCVSGELGLRKFLEDRGHTLVVTSDKDGDGCELEQHLPDTDIVMSRPFWPAYITRERMEMAPNLKMCVTCGIGSDHVDLQAAMERNITVTEVTYCNSISVSEHVCMMILGLVRNYIPSYQQVVAGGWNIADCVQRAYDVEGMNVGPIASSRIGLAVLRRMHPFDCKLHYTDRHRLPAEVEEELNLTYHENVEDMVKVCDVVTINCPLHPQTEHLFDDDMLSK